MYNQKNSYLKEEILEIISLTRGHILDTLEIEIGETRSWKSIRSRILKIMGDRGLEGKILKLLSKNHSFSNGHGNEDLCHEYSK